MRSSLRIFNRSVLAKSSYPFMAITLLSLRNSMQPYCQKHSASSDVYRATNLIQVHDYFLFITSFTLVAKRKRNLFYKMDSTSSLYILKLVLCSWWYLLAFNTKRGYADTQNQTLWKLECTDDEEHSTMFSRNVGEQKPCSAVTHLRRMNMSFIREPKV